MLHYASVKEVAQIMTAKPDKVLLGFYYVLPTMYRYVYSRM